MSAVLKEPESKELSINSLRVQTVPAVIAGNFAELNKWIDELVDSKVTVVTEETIGKEKKELAMLRALAKEIDGKTKEVIALVVPDVDLFTKNMKALKAKVLKAVEDKDGQVNNLEAKTLKTIKDMLSNVLHIAWESLKLENEYRKSTIDDLVKLGSQSKTTGALLPSVIAQVESRARQDESLKNRTEARVTYMQNQCLTQGINSPLERIHIESFLFVESNTDFQESVQNLVDVELQRMATAEQNFKENAQKSGGFLAVALEKQAEELSAPAPAPEPALIPATLTPEPVQAEVQYAPEPVRHPFQTLEPAPVAPEGSVVYMAKVTYIMTEVINFSASSKFSIDKITAHYLPVFASEKGISVESVLEMEVKSVPLP